jgi:hypothetical protein
MQANMVLQNTVALRKELDEDLPYQGISLHHLGG